MKRVFKILNSRILNYVFPLSDFLHIYQLEEYDNGFFLKWSLPRIYKRNLQKVGELAWTQKAKLLYFLSFFLIISSSFFAALIGRDFRFLPLALAVNCLVIPFWLVIAKTLLLPIEFFLKSKEIRKAKNKLSKMAGLTIIAICGSVGKTTTRHFLTELLKTKYKTFTTSGNINTPLGIANEINGKMSGDTEVFVVELGEYRPGDLVKIANLFPPEILVYTKIGSQHLDKFGSQKAINQEFLSLKSLRTIKQIFVGKKNLIASDLAGSGKVKIVDPKPNLKIIASKAKSFGENLNLAMAAAIYMGVSKRAIDRTLPELSPLPQRLATTVQNGVTVIDDSYNISLESAENALNFLSTFDGRKILVTGGIVEQGENSLAANKTFGSKISQVADIVVLAKNNFYGEVVNGIKAAKRQVQIIDSPGPDKTPTILARIVKSGDVVLVQNELPEVYWH